MRRNADGTVTAVAANGHLMRYQVKPNGDLVQWNATCDPRCGACTDGDVRPDW